MAKGKHRLYMAGFTAGIALLLILGFLPFFFVKNSFITAQQNIIGELYERDPALCAEIVPFMFQKTTFWENTKKGEEAMLSLGYTKEGSLYLFQNTGWSKIFYVVFLVQGILVLISFFFFLRLKTAKASEEETLIFDIQNEREISVSEYTFFGKNLLFEISNLLKLLHTKENYLLEKNKQIQRFIENIAHQIKTPLNCISISLDLMSETGTKAQKEQISDCFQYLNNIETLMKKLLDIGRLETGKILMHKEAMQLNELFDECKSLLPKGEERITICQETYGKKLLSYYGDYEWLKEAFLNILKNCLEHDNSQKKILVLLSETAEGVKITIKDHGTGIPKEDMPYIFDRFYIPKNAKKSHSGIGLNLAKLVIEAHFGSFSANNHEEGGAVFTVLLPVFNLKNEKI